MATVTLRELARNTAAVLQAIETSGRPALVTRNGRPVAALVPIDDAALEDWLLQRSPSLTRTVAGADPDLDTGRVRSGEWQQAHDHADGETETQLGSTSPSLRGSHRGE